jgi:hypothetical protein
MERLLARQCAAIYDLQPKVGLPAWKGGHPMSRKVADVLWEMLANAGVKRCYGIVGDALNPIIDGLRDHTTPTADGPAEIANSSLAPGPIAAT